MQATSGRRKTYLIHNPYDADGLKLIRTIFTMYGLRPVCLYTDRKARFYGERDFPELASPLVEEAIDVAGLDAAAIADEVGSRYDVVAVLPWGEIYVELAAELHRHLGIEWNDPDTLLRFRDKHSLKQHVARVAPGVRVPSTRLVRTPADLDGPLPDRFVIKPNDGYGNRFIGIFDRDHLDEARSHVATQPDTTWVLEEFIGGTEYHIDGQVREAGDVVCLGVWEYFRAQVGGYSTVYVGEVQVMTGDAVFAELVDYAERLLAATDLRRCPFHLEVKMDDRGPCVVDLGARFASDGGADLIGRLHPYRPDPFSVAASDYLGGSLLLDDHVDWTHYDSARTIYAYGLSEQAGFVGELRGFEQVEAMPEFTVWSVKPKVGDRIKQTRELRDMTYLAQLACSGTRDDAIELLQHVRSSLEVCVAADAKHRADALGRNLSRRVVPKLRWVNHVTGEAARSAAKPLVARLRRPESVEAQVVTLGDDRPADAVADEREFSAVAGA